MIGESKRGGKGVIIRGRYEATASGYDELYRAEQYEKYFVALGKVPPRGRVLDAGCGTGLLLEFMGLNRLLSDVTEYVCLDYSLSMLRIARSRMKVYCRRSRMACGVVEANIENIPFISNSFDIVYSFTVLDLVDDLKKAVKELKRVSKGPIIVSMLKKLPYKDRLIRAGYSIIGVSSKDVIFRL